MLALKMFEDALLSMESGIDAKNAAWYAGNLNRAVLKYWAVIAPGELRRNRETGAPELENVTVAQYFDRLGVGWVVNQISEQSLRIAQYAVVNAWGFIGYQFGEALLYETGHYVPERVTWLDEMGNAVDLKNYYSGDVPNEKWSEGVIVTPHDPYGRGGLILATHVNRWKGRFTGLDEVKSISDLREPQIQIKVFRRILRHNHLKLRLLCETSGLCLADQIEKISRKERCNYSLSGCLAGSHLCGVEAMFRYLTSETDTKDETGTTLRSYLKRFSGFDLDELSGVDPAEGGQL